MSEAEGFLSRWARRKREARSGTADEAEAAPPPPARADAVPPAGARPPSDPTAAAAGTPPALPARPGEAEAPPLPTLADVARLASDGDYAPFLRPGVAAEVRRAALRKLFADPHYHAMDGLDIYIGDYTRPDPVSPAMLRRLTQSRLLGLFRDEAPVEPEAAQGVPASCDGAGGPDPGAVSALPPSAGEMPQSPPADAALAVDPVQQMPQETPRQAQAQTPQEVPPR